MIIVDPAMADDGRLYSIYTPDMVVAMRQLVSKAHIVKPNYTEACFLLDIPFSTDPISDDELRDRCKDCTKWGLTWLSWPAYHRKRMRLSRSMMGPNWII